MGLDTTHGCWHGAYSAFMRWREMLADAAGYPPLRLMEGFYQPEDWWFMTGRPDVTDPKMYRFHEKPKGLSYEIERVMQSLPIRWDLFASDPLTVLLNHPDCEGEIEAQHCGPLADRLEALLPKIPDGEGGGHVGNWREKTKTFIDGLWRAAAAGEDVRFH